MWETASPSPPSWGSSKSSSLSPSANLNVANFTGVVTFRLLLRVTVRATTPGAWQCRREVSQLSHTIIPSWMGRSCHFRSTDWETHAKVCRFGPCPHPRPTAVSSYCALNDIIRLEIPLRVGRVASLLFVSFPFIVGGKIMSSIGPFLYSLLPLSC